MTVRGGNTARGTRAGHGSDASYHEPSDKRHRYCSALCDVCAEGRYLRGLNRCGIFFRAVDLVQKMLWVSAMVASLYEEVDEFECVKYFVFLDSIVLINITEHRRKIRF